MSKVRRVGDLVVLAAAVALLALLLLSRTPAASGSSLASTRCTMDGPVQAIDVTRIAPEDTLPVRAHEDVHAAQCAELGWLKVRLKNLTVGGRISLEAPGYCAGARTRLRRGDDFAITRERLLDDMNAMFAGQADSSRVNAALRRACPEIAGR